MNLVSLFLLLGVAAVVYLGWIFVPPWLDSLDVREATSAAFNRMGSDPEDGRVRTFLLGRLNSIGTHWEMQQGVKTEVPGLGLREDDIRLERDRDNRTARVSIDYQRELRLKPTDKFYTLDYHAEKAGKLPQ